MIKIKKIILSLLLGITITGLSVANISAANPTTPIQLYPNIEFATGNSGLSAEYSFTPKLTKQTKMTVTHDSTTTSYQMNADTTVTIKPTNGGFAPQASVYFTNVGTYQGKSIDAHVTAASVNSKELTIKMIGASITRNTANQEAGIRVNTLFYESGSRTPINIKGYLSFTKVNSNKILTLQDSLLGNAAHKIVTNNSIILYDDNEFSGSTTSLASDTTMTLTYDGILRLSFDALLDASNTNTSVIAVETSPESLVKIEAPVPTKTGFTVDKGFEEISKLYTISQSVPFQDKSWYYKDFVIEDDLSKLLEVNSGDIIVKDQLDNDVTSKFDITIDSANHLKVTAKSSALASVGFYNVDYTVEINGKIDPASNFTPSIVNGKVKVDNIASTTIDGTYTKTSNSASSFFDKLTRVVTYVNEKNDVIHKPVTITGFPGDNYTTTQFYITGYNFKEVVGVPSGTWDTNTTNIKYIYSKKIVPPVISAKETIYKVGTKKTEAGYFIDSKAKANNGSAIVSNFSKVVNLNKVGKYKVTIKSAPNVNPKAQDIVVIVRIVGVPPKPKPRPKPKPKPDPPNDIPETGSNKVFYALTSITLFTLLTVTYYYRKNN